MALILDREVKGVIAQYWTIMGLEYLKVRGTTIVTLGLFYTKEARDAGLNNDLTTTTLEFGSTPALADWYDKVKESHVEEYEISPEVVSGNEKEVDTNIFSFDKRSTAVMGTRETNPFARAVSDNLPDQE